MSAYAKIAMGLLIPLLGTTLGSAMVFALKKEMGDNLKKALLGFASGVMIAASVWSLIMPALDMSPGEGFVKCIPAAVGFLGGMGFLLLLDMLIPHLHANSDSPEGMKSNFEKSLMLILAVTLHNLPEGMAVGVVFAGMLSDQALVSTAGAIALSIGIAIQNFPEGAIISMPLVSAGASRKKAFGYGFMSGAVEPIGALLTILLTSLITSALPYILAFAAGAMVYVVVEELIPDAQAEPHTNIGTIGVAFGFALMMILDVSLG